jgi:NAD(P)-dependent dehydrogenase (short-subunit alcohol dehydrogenase family)
MRVAVITGASRGFGRAVAQSLASDGWRLVLDGRDAETLERAADDLRSVHGAEVIAVIGDVSDASHRSAVAAAAASLGRLDLLVNNASTLGASPLPLLAEYPLDELERAFRVNVAAPLGLIQLALPMLAPGARIINVSSDAAVEAYEGWGGYGASKAAFDQLTNVLAAEHEDVRIYAVDPGDMNTQMQQEAYPGEDVSDRPPPAESIPGLLTLIEGELPSGRYAARELALPAHA